MHAVTLPISFVPSCAIYIFLSAQNVEEELVVPVVAPCSGCPHPAPLNDPTILEVADFALREYDRTSTDEDNLHILLRLIKAQSQVLFFCFPNYLCTIHMYCPRPFTVYLSIPSILSLSIIFMLTSFHYHHYHHHHSYHLSLLFY